MGHSKVLIIGSTGYIGKHVARASLALGHPTFLLLRPTTASDPAKGELIESFKALGASILHGSLEDKASLVEAIKQVDVVVSTVGGRQLADQVHIIEAIKEVGTVKRFLPSEFGLDVDHDLSNDVLKTFLGVKVKIRRAVEAAGIPYTYVSNNAFAGYFLANLCDVGSSPSKEKVTIYADGNTKAVFVVEEDVGTYTIKAVDDPKTENKTLYIRPPANILSQNEIVAIWEKKIGKTLEKDYLSKEELARKIPELPFPSNITLAFRHSFFVGGDAVFEIGPNGVDASELYPDVKYTTAEAYLDRFL
eukprot:c26698_g1_i1 orf=565-1479(-)